MGVFASDSRLVQPRSLDWGPNGNLFVAGLGTEYEPGNGSVVEFDGVTGSFVRVIASELAMPNGLAFGPDGNLYVGLQGIATIKRYHGTTGEFIDDFATGLPSNLIGITWATVTAPEPTGVILFSIGCVAMLRLRSSMLSPSRRFRRPQVRESDRR
jgi:DNA-binding beta-propeller fold protein YncE